MALDLTGSTNFPNTPNIKTLIGKNYDRKLTQSIQNLLSEIPKQSPKCSDFAEEFYEKMQARVDPHLESTWVYVALAFRSWNHPKDDHLDRVSTADDLFQLLSMCSASCDSSKSVAMLAPVVRQVYNVGVDLFKMDLSWKREKKVMRNVRDFVGTILGYINLCSFEDSGSLITPFSGLIRVWMNSNEGLESFLPLVSSDIFGGLNEGECELLSWSCYGGGVFVETLLGFQIRDFGVGVGERVKHLGYRFHYNVWEVLPFRILQQIVCYDSSKMLPETLLGKPICEHKRKLGFELASEPEAEADAGA
ncbi:hypothetical protein FF1_032018 [Malus domestica]